MTTMRNCVLCFNEFEEEKASSYPLKLPELIVKYLHSSITQDILLSGSCSSNLPFCSKCFGLTMELYNLNDQLEFCQKSIFELVFIRSLEILYRRGKRLSIISDLHNKPNYPETKRQLAEFDISSLPNCDFKNTYSDVPETAVTSEEVCQDLDRPEDVCDGDLKYPFLIPPSTVNIEFVDELSMTDESHQSSASHAVDTNLTSKKEKGNLELFRSDTETKIQNPILKLQRLNFRNGDQKVVSVGKGQNNVDVKNGEMYLQTVWTKCALNRTYKMTTAKKMQASNICNQDLEFAENGTSLFGQQIIPMEIFAANSRLQDDEPNCELNPLDNETATSTFEEYEKSFSLEQKFDVHEGINSEEVSTKCNLGEGQFKSKVSTNSCEELPFECDVCKGRFKLRFHLAAHKKSHREGTSNGYGSLQLPLTYLRKIHSAGVRAYKCDICGKEFTRRNNAIRHIRMHTGERRFKCTLCDKRFTRKVSMERHMKVHTEDIVLFNFEMNYETGQ